MPSKEDFYNVQTHAPGPAGSLPLQAEWLRASPSGDVFGWTMDAAMGWNPDQLGKAEFLILSTQGGIRAPDGTWGGCVYDVDEIIKRLENR